MSKGVSEFAVVSDPLQNNKHCAVPQKHFKIAVQHICSQYAAKVKLKWAAKKQ